MKEVEDKEEEGDKEVKVSMCQLFSARLRRRK